MSPTIVYPSRERLLKLLLGSSAVVGCAVWILTLPDAPFKALVCAWLGVPIFGLTTGFLIKRWAFRKPAVVLDEEGITVNASWLSVGFIPWSDVTNAGVTSYLNQRFLGISLQNSEKYFARVGFVKRYFMRTNASSIGYAVSIPEVTLPISVEELLGHVRCYLEAYGNRQRA